MKRILVFIYLTVLSSLCHSVELDNFSTEQKILYTTMQGITLVDWGQTRYISKHTDRFNEGNPLIGKTPSLAKVNTVFTVRLLAQHYGFQYLPQEYLTPSLIAVNVVYGFTILHNNRLGVKMDTGGNDKPKHFAISAAVAASARAYGLNKWQAFGASMTVGVLKEVYDSRSGGSGFSKDDLAADFLGAVSGTVLGGLVITPNKIAYSVQTNIF
jgi:putative lipoprotein